MPFDPRQYQGRPLLQLLDDLAHMPLSVFEEAEQGKVELFAPVGVSGGLLDPTVVRPESLLSTWEDVDLPANHPDVEVPGVELEECLGKGFQGWVYTGRVLATGKRIAVKVVRPRNATGREPAATDEAFADEVIREASICGRLRHRNIRRVFQAKPAGAYWVFLMELIRGPELNRVEPADARARSWFGQLADALETLAANRVVHRDVKPANILIRQRDGSPVLVDFGLAVDLDALGPAAEPGAICGTLPFIPPEVFDQALPHPAWDAYSLGMTAVAAVIGYSSNYSTTQTLVAAKRTGEFERSVQQSLSGLTDTELRWWIMTLLDREPSQRTQALAFARRWHVA